MCSLKISLARCCAYFEVSLPLVAMPFQKKKADKKYVKAVPVFKLFTKAKLRSYADSNGCLLLCGEQGTAPAKHFKIKEVREQLSSENSELVNRPAMGINLTAATISGGAEVLPFLSDPQVSFSKTGLDKMGKLVDKDLTKLAKVLNVKNKLCGDREKLNEQVAAFLELLGNTENAEERMKTYARVADVGSRLYGLAMALMETTSLATNPKAWAKKIPDLQKQSSAIKKFVKNPTLENLAAAVAKENAARSRDDKKAKKFGDSESSAADSDASDSSTSSDKKKKTGKKDKKKDGKKSKKSSSSASEESNDSSNSKKKRKVSKKKAGGRKDAEKKRGFGQESSSSAEESESKKKKGDTGDEAKSGKPKKPSGPVLKIRRQMQTDAQADTDPVDEVEFTDGETIENVVDKLLKALGIPVEVKENWNARVNIITDETGEKRATVQPVAWDAPAASDMEIMLVRKGG